MEDKIEKILKKLGLKPEGKYENHFYVIPVANSDDYAKMYTLLSKNAINTEFPEFTKNTNGTTIKVVNYFELEVDSVIYDIFLIANFDDDEYYVKIGER